MTTFSPVEAALEGLRTARHRPGLVLTWAASYFVMLALLGVFMALVLGGEVRQDIALLARTNDPGELIEIVARRNGLLLVLILLALGFISVLSTAIIRSVLHPGESRLAYLRVGPEEGRQFLVSLINSGLALVVTAIPTALLLLVGTALFQAGAVTAAGWLGFLGTLAVTGLSVWVAVRLSLFSAVTFAEGTINPRRAWTLTHGHFWHLMGMFLLTLLLALLVSVIGSILSGVVVAMFGGGADSAVLLVLVGLLANLLMAPFFLTVQTVILVSAPASAYGRLHASELTV